MKLKISFRELYLKDGIKEIINKINGSISSKLSNGNSETICKAINITSKSFIKSLSIICENEEFKNSAQSVYVSFVQKLCDSNASYFELLKDKNWLYENKDQSSDSKRRYGLIQKNGVKDCYIYKDANITLLMLRSIRILFDIEREDLLDKCYFLLEINNEEIDQSLKESNNIVDEHFEGNYSFSSCLSLTNFKRNWIIFGAPGTGKSHLLNKERKKLLGEKCEINYERVTFHPDYSYANFVGSYKPVMKSQSLDSDTKSIINILNDNKTNAQNKYDTLYKIFSDKRQSIILPILVGMYTKEEFVQKTNDGRNIDNCYEGRQGIELSKYINTINTQNLTGDIGYEYVPGPFMRMYVKAMRNVQNVMKGTEPPIPYLLIIEEINRANVAAVFGDIFQLLDRGDDNVSEYPIQASEDMKNYLSKELGGNPENYSQIRIPDNLFIWATMNSADQGVFPIDTAFKRRWGFTYLGINDKDGEIANLSVEINGKTIYWNALRKAINDYLAKIGINEDKQLGPFFLKKDVISDGKKFCEVFKHKIIMYLFEDAAKQKRASVFSGLEREKLRYSKICEEFDKRGIEIFDKEIQKNYADYTAYDAAVNNYNTQMQNDEES